MNNFLLLIIEFFKTGLFSVGGGLATIPFLYEMISKYGWFSPETLSTMIAVSESTPGPMGVNMATYVGFNVEGVWGALTTTLALVAPSIIVISIVANMFNKFKNSKIVKEVFAGLRPAVLGFIISACLSIFISALFNIEALQQGDFLALFNYKSWILLAICLLVNYKYKSIHPIFYIVFTAIIGMLFQF